jgi:hypothetical protein
MSESFYALISRLVTRPGDQAVETLIEEARSHMSAMFKICEAIAILDMVCVFVQRYNHSLKGCRLHPSHILSLCITTVSKTL